MKLEHLVLGVLGVHPATGYDLKKFFDTHGRFLRAHTQMSQVYRVLASMTERRWVRFEVESRPGPRDAKTYHLTTEGFSEFMSWLTGPYDPPSRFKDPEFSARLSFAGFMTEGQILEIVDTELNARIDQVARYGDRDRNVGNFSAFPFDHELEAGISEVLHQWGSADVLQHIDRLKGLRALLVDGRLRRGADQGNLPVRELDSPSMSS